MTNKDDLLPTRRSLLTRLKNWDDQESWRDFFNAYWKLIYGVAVRAGLTDAEAQDVVQETIFSVATKMKDFNYNPGLGSFKNWLRLITRRRIADQQRRTYRQPLRAQRKHITAGATATVEKIPDPISNIDAIWDEEWHKHVLQGAVEKVRPKIDPKQFQIFDCYVLKEWPVDDVVKALRVSAGQVYLAKHRISALVKKEIEQIEERLVSALAAEPEQSVVR